MCGWYIPHPVVLKKKQSIVLVLIVWISLIGIVAVLLGNLMPEQYFAFCLIGVTAIAYLTEPKYVQPRHTRYLKYVSTLGTVAFILLVLWVIMASIGV